jgi:hypothetical protein
MIECVNLYITREDFAKHESFLKSFKNSAVIFDYLPKRLREHVLKAYKEIPFMEVQYSSGDFIRKSGEEDIFSWLESHSDVLPQ